MNVDTKATARVNSIAIKDTTATTTAPLAQLVFVEGVASADGLDWCCKKVSGANVECIGINDEDRIDGAVTTIWMEPSIAKVIHDGTVSVGDFVTNDEDGYATPITASSTPIDWHSHGKCVKLDQSPNSDATEWAYILMREEIINM